MAAPKKEAAGPQPEREAKVAKGLVPILAASVLLALLLSIAVMYWASHDLSASGYYTLSSMFGTNEEGYSMLLISQLSPGSVQYYFVVGALALDGLVKYVIIGFSIAIMLDVLAGVNLESKLRGLIAGKVSGHVVLCGYTSFAERVCEDLGKKGIRFEIVERDGRKIEAIRSDGYTPIDGDFTDVRDLARANVSRAKSVIFCGENDYTTLLGIVTARGLSKSVSIMCRARDENTVPKMQRAGADRCVIPELLAGLELGQVLSGV
jgi:hypothetical protein